MDWIETIQLRSHRKSDRDAAIESFEQLVFSSREPGVCDLFLLQDAELDQDLCIVIQGEDETAHTGKSPLGIRLAAAFSQFGRIDHHVWRLQVPSRRRAIKG